MASPSPGDLLPLTIDRPAAGGRMIARVEGLVVLVSGAIPGERVVAVVERVGKGVAYATVREVQEQSPDRRRGPIDLLCGGSLYAHIEYPRQLELKSAVIVDAFARIAHVDLPDTVVVVPSPEAGYRMRARLHLSQARVGFFREGTHELCEARATRQLLPETMDVLDRLAGTLQTERLDGVQALELSENARATERVVHLDATSPLSAHALERLAKTDGLTGLSSFEGVQGSQYVHDALTRPAGAIVLRRHVLAFFQGNRFLLDHLVSHVVDRVGPAGTVIDLYAGVGLFAGALALDGAEVTAVEGDRVSAADLLANAKALSGHLRGTHLSVEAFVAHGGVRADALVVDPPRTGLSRAAHEGILKLRVPRVVYVSCDVATLARDVRRFVDGGYTLTRLDGFDLFPNTPHIESVAVLSLEV